MFHIFFLSLYDMDLVSDEDLVDDLNLIDNEVNKEDWVDNEDLVDDKVEVEDKVEVGDNLERKVQIVNDLNIFVGLVWLGLAHQTNAKNTVLIYSSPQSKEVFDVGKLGYVT